MIISSLLNTEGIASKIAFPLKLLAILFLVIILSFSWLGVRIFKSGGNISLGPSGEYEALAAIPIYGPPPAPDPGCICACYCSCACSCAPPNEAPSVGNITVQ